MCVSSVKYSSGNEYYNISVIEIRGGEYNAKNTCREYLCFEKLMLPDLNN
jgi:hypothetical protein